MIQLVALKALAGLNYVRVDQVIAISATDPAKCKPAKDVIAKLEAASSGKQE